MNWGEPSAVAPTARVAPGGRTGAGAMFGAAFETMFKVNASEARYRGIEEAFDQELARFQEETGLEIAIDEQQAVRRSMSSHSPLAGVVAYGLQRHDQYFKEFERLRSERPDLAATIPTEKSINARMAANAQSREAREADLASRAGFGAKAAGFGGSLVGAMGDPINQASLFVGGPSKTIIGAGFKGAGISSGSEAVIQPFVQTHRADVGLDAGLGQAASNIGFAALGGGLFEGGAKALRVGGGRVIGGIKERRAVRHVSVLEDLTNNPSPEISARLNRKPKARLLTDEEYPDLQGKAVRFADVGDSEIDIFYDRVGDDIAIDIIVPRTNDPSTAFEVTKNTVGPATVRRALRVLREFEPDAKTVSGVRITGARETGAGDGRTVIKLPRRRQDLLDAAKDADLTPTGRQAVMAVEADVDMAERSLGADTASAAHAHEAAVDAIVREAGESESGRVQVVPVSSMPVARDGAGLDLGGLQAFRASDLNVDATLFQFKSGADVDGVTDRLSGVSQWDPVKAGMTVVWRDLGGKMWVADGHQRSGLARRLEADGHAPITLYGKVLDAADGVSAEQARAIAAMKNLAEGSGTAVDAAKVLRVSPELLDGSVPLSSGKVRHARDMMALTDDAFLMVVNGVVPEHIGAMVGRLAPNELQDDIMRLMVETKPDNLFQAEAMVRQALDGPVVRETTGSLFGEEDIVRGLYRERAKILDQAVKLLRRDKTVFNTLLREDVRIQGQGGNRLDRNANQKKVDLDGQAEDIIQRLANRVGPISDALNAAAEGLGSGRIKAAAAAREFIDAVRTSIDGGSGPAGRAGDGDPIGGNGRGPDGPDADDVPAQSAGAAAARLEDIAADDLLSITQRVEDLETDLFGDPDVARPDLVVGQKIDENGNPVADMMTAADADKAIDEDLRMLDRLRGCAYE